MISHGTWERLICVGNESMGTETHKQKKIKDLLPQDSWSNLKPPTRQAKKDQRLTSSRFMIQFETTNQTSKKRSKTYFLKIHDPIWNHQPDKQKKIKDLLPQDSWSNLKPPTRQAKKDQRLTSSRFMIQFETTNQTSKKRSKTYFLKIHDPIWNHQPDKQKKIKDLLPQDSWSNLKPPTRQAKKDQRLTSSRFMIQFETTNQTSKKRSKTYFLKIHDPIWNHQPDKQKKIKDLLPQDSWSNLKPPTRQAKKDQRLTSSRFMIQFETTNQTSKKRSKTYFLKIHDPIWNHQPDKQKKIKDLLPQDSWSNLKPPTRQAKKDQRLTSSRFMIQFETTNQTSKKRSKTYFLKIHDPIWNHQPDKQKKIKDLLPQDSWSNLKPPTRQAKKDQRLTSSRFMIQFETTNQTSKKRSKTYFLKIHDPIWNHQPDKQKKIKDLLPQDSWSNLKPPTRQAKKDQRLTSSRFMIQFETTNQTSKKRSKTYFLKIHDPIWNHQPDKQKKIKDLLPQDSWSNLKPPTRQAKKDQRLTSSRFMIQFETTNQTSKKRSKTYFLKIHDPIWNHQPDKQKKIKDLLPQDSWSNLKPPTRQAKKDQRLTSSRFMIQFETTNQTSKKRSKTYFLKIHDPIWNHQPDKQKKIKDLLPQDSWSNLKPPTRQAKKDQRLTSSRFMIQFETTNQTSKKRSKTYFLKIHDPIWNHQPDKQKKIKDLLPQDSWSNLKPPTRQAKKDQRLTSSRFMIQLETTNQTSKKRSKTYFLKIHDPIWNHQPDKQKKIKDLLPQDSWSNLKPPTRQAKKDQRLTSSRFMIQFETTNQTSKKRSKTYFLKIHDPIWNHQPDKQKKIKDLLPQDSWSNLKPPTRQAKKDQRLTSSRFMIQFETTNQTSKKRSKTYFLKIHDPIWNHQPDKQKKIKDLLPQDSWSNLKPPTRQAKKDQRLTSSRFMIQFETTNQTSKKRSKTYFLKIHDPIWNHQPDKQKKIKDLLPQDSWSNLKPPTRQAKKDQRLTSSRFMIQFETTNQTSKKRSKTYFLKIHDPIWNHQPDKQKKIKDLLPQDSWSNLKPPTRQAKKDQRLTSSRFMIQFETTNQTSKKRSKTYFLKIHDPIWNHQPDKQKKIKDLLPQDSWSNLKPPTRQAKKDQRLTSSRFMIQFETTNQTSKKRSKTYFLKIHDPIWNHQPDKQKKIKDLHPQDSWSNLKPPTRQAKKDQRLTSSRFMIQFETTNQTSKKRSKTYFLKIHDPIWNHQPDKQKKIKDLLPQDSWSNLKPPTRQAKKDQRLTSSRFMIQFETTNQTSKKRSKTYFLKIHDPIWNHQPDKQKKIKDLHPQDSWSNLKPPTRQAKKVKDLLPQDSWSNLKPPTRQAKKDQRLTSSRFMIQFETTNQTSKKRSKTYFLKIHDPIWNHQPDKQKKIKDLHPQDSWSNLKPPTRQAKKDQRLTSSRFMIQFETTNQTSKKRSKTYILKIHDPIWNHQPDKQKRSKTYFLKIHDPIWNHQPDKQKKIKDLHPQDSWSNLKPPTRQAKKDQRLTSSRFMIQFETTNQTSKKRSKTYFLKIHDPIWNHQPDKQKKIKDLHPQDSWSNLKPPTRQAKKDQRLTSSRFMIQFETTNQTSKKRSKTYILKIHDPIWNHQPDKQKRSKTYFLKIHDPIWNHQPDKQKKIKDLHPQDSWSNLKPPTRQAKKDQRLTSSRFMIQFETTNQTSKKRSKTYILKIHDPIWNHQPDKQKKIKDLHPQDSWSNLKPPTRQAKKDQRLTSSRFMIQFETTNQTSKKRSKTYIPNFWFFPSFPWCRCVSPQGVGDALGFGEAKATPGGAQGCQVEKSFGGVLGQHPKTGNLSVAEWQLSNLMI